MPNDHEVHRLIRELSKFVLELVSDLESADDVLSEGKYHREMATYDAAREWLKNNPEK